MAATSEAPTTTNARARILIVDSEQVWHEKLHEVLSAEFDVSHCHSYPEATKCIESEEKPFDIIITEIRLDEAESTDTGFYVLDSIENQKVYTQVIILSRYLTIKNVREVHNRHSVHTYESKVPEDELDFNFDRFMQIVRDALRKICVFVFMPFSPSYQKFYDNHIKRIVNQTGRKCERADETFRPGLIYEKVLHGIQRSSIILADVSEGRLDVYFEAGLSQAHYRSVVVLSRHDKYVPSLMLGIERVPYNPKDVNGFEDKLSRAIQDIHTQKYPSRLRRTNGDAQAVEHCLAIVPDSLYGSEVYQKIILPAALQQGLECTSTSQIYSPNNYVQQVWDKLHQCELVIADLGQKDPNTLYLVGLAYGLNKQVVLLVRDESDLPYCLKSSNPIKYTGVEKTRADEIQSLISAIKFNRGEKVENPRDGQQMVDVVILTVLPEEFDAVKSQIANLQKWSGAINAPSLYAWHTGSIPSKSNGLPYKVALGIVGRSGNVNSAMAVREALERWSPRYVFFVGIAGGLNESKKGDVTVADTIYGYDYGDVGKVFTPRMDWTYGTDQGLLTGMTVYARSGEWLTRIIGTPPQACTPNFATGYIASGEKVVDDPTNEFFTAILKVWPRLTAVEMEGVGIATAITQAHAVGKVVGYVMVRGISDLPRPESENGEEQGARERENWKPYASAVAAALTVGYVADGLPVPPRSS